MGIEQRDYYRGDSRDYGRPSGFWDMPVVCKRLMIAVIVTYVAQIVITRPATVADLRATMSQQELEEGEGSPDFAIEDALAWTPPVSVLEDVGDLNPSKVAGGQVWRLVTYAFLHERMGVWSILINMIFLYWFGTRLEQMYGPTEFALFYFASILVAAVAFLGFSFYTGNAMISNVGASGAIWALVVLYVIHHPYEQVHIYFLFPIQIRWLALIYLLYNLHPVLLQLNGGGGFVGGISQAANLGGAAFGALYFYRSWRLTPLWQRVRGKSSSSRWQTRTVRAPARSTIPFDRGTLDATRSEPSRSPIDPATKKLEAQLDQVLEKIQTSGRESLTDEEILILEQASQKYRDR
ncbi:MAG: rhomboid family intramembrane serine protease [Planctomycetota bacterium]